MRRTDRRPPDRPVRLIEQITSRAYQRDGAQLVQKPLGGVNPVTFAIAFLTTTARCLFGLYTYGQRGAADIVAHADRRTA
jgi:hypothetical protein